MSLIKPDFENWMPHKPTHQNEMKLAHGFDTRLNDLNQLDNELKSRRSSVLDQDSNNNNNNEKNPYVYDNLVRIKKGILYFIQF
jgi:hypothetical protein